MFSRKKALKQLEVLKRKGRQIRLAAEGWENDWQKLIAIILSARTKDEVTISVCENLFKKFPTMEDFSKLNLANIKRLIYNINFYENKSKYLQETTEKLITDFNGKVPKKVEELITLPGVGKKTANVFLAEMGKDYIGVDTHVNYISNYLGWTNSKNPEIIEKELKKLFPKTKWRELNKILVRFGKTYISKIEKNKILDEIKKIK
jgi:endonuclease-3